jgi:hypothetical protein
VDIYVEDQKLTLAPGACKIYESSRPDAVITTIWERVVFTPVTGLTQLLHVTREIWYVRQGGNK